METCASVLMLNVTEQVTIHPSLVKHAHIRLKRAGKTALQQRQPAVGKQKG